MDPVIKLADERLAVDPGGLLVTTARIRNKSEQVEQYRFEVLGRLAPFVRVQPERVSADVEREQVVTLQIRPPRSATAPSGELKLGLRVISLEDEDRCATAETTVVVGDIHNLTGEMRTVRSRGRWSGLYRVELANRGTVAVRAHLEAQDTDRHLAIAVAPRVIEVPADDAATAYVRVKARAPALAGKPLRLPFTVRVAPLDASISDINLSAAFERTPILSRGALIAAGIAAVAVVAVAAASLRSSVGSATAAATTPPASAVVQLPASAISRVPTTVPTSTAAPTGSKSATSSSSSTSTSSSTSSSSSSSSPSPSGTGTVDGVPSGPAPNRPYTWLALHYLSDSGAAAFTARDKTDAGKLGLKNVQSYADPQLDVVIVYVPSPSSVDPGKACTAAGVQARFLQCHGVT